MEEKNFILQDKKNADEFGLSVEGYPKLDLEKWSVQLIAWQR